MPDPDWRSAAAPPLILLMGMRGCGKTTVGRLLAERLHTTFDDLDDLALARFDATSVRSVWERFGEADWRAAEHEALREVLDSKSTGVVALGGGTPMFPQSHRRIKESRAEGRVFAVYLCAAAPILRARLAGDEGDRPSLTGASIAQELAGVLARREAAYESLADLVVDATEPPRSVVDRIVEQIPQ